MCRGRYNSKYVKADTMTVWGTTNGVVDLKQLISFKNQNIGLGWQ